MSMATYGSLFTGVGGMDLGLDQAGLKCQFQIENDPDCLQTLKYHWPNVYRDSDIQNVTAHILPDVDLIAFGSPCQDLSYAGLRNGLGAEQSSLFYDGTRIINEMQIKTNGEYPKWTIWENVVGTLTSKGGNDFDKILKQMVKSGAIFSEWVVLDAQYFGVPQRRRRLFVVSCYDSRIAKRCASKILPVKEGVRRYPEKNRYRKKDEEYNPDTASCLRSGGKGGKPSSRGENLITVEDGDHLSVRQLMPIECERLMGWPDNHTLYRADGKINSDSIRYKMCGNGAVSPVVQWIVDQIKEI